MADISDDSSDHRPQSAFPGWLDPPMNLKCSHCGSEDLESVPRAYEGAISPPQGQGAGRAVGLTSGPDSPGSAAPAASSQAASQSRQNLAPPKTEPVPSIHGLGCGLAITLGVLLLAFAAFACIDAGAAAFYGGKSPQRARVDRIAKTLLIMAVFVVGGAACASSANGKRARKAREENLRIQERNQKAHQEWQHSHLCRGCGAITVIKPEIQPGTLDTASRLSPEVRRLARDPGTKIAAVKLNYELTPGHGLAEAKREVDDYLASVGRQV